MTAIEPLTQAEKDFTETIMVQYIDAINLTSKIGAAIFYFLTRNVAGAASLSRAGLLSKAYTWSALTCSAARAGHRSRLLIVPDLRRKIFSGRDRK
jgi:hypothetical protein